ncbi:MAG: hypothetical protein AB7F79_02845 [Steroidobacteraceae bacterium]
MVKQMARILMASGMVAGMSFGMPTYAGGWGTTGSVQLAGNYDDNARLSTLNVVSAASGSSDLSAKLLYQDDSFLCSINPRMLALRYDGDRTLNRTEGYLTLLARRTTETGSNSVSLAGTSDTTLTSELGTTGLSEINKQRRNVATTINTQWDVTEKFSTSTQLYAAANRYIDAKQTGLVDYNYGSVLINSVYQWTNQSSLSLQASAGKLQVPEYARLNKTNQSVTLGYVVQWSPQWSSNVSLGPSRIQTRSGTQSGSVYNIGFSREAERSMFSASVAREVTPNGFGSLSQREKYQFNWNVQLTDRWSSNWSATAIRNENIAESGAPAGDRLTYSDISGSVTWRITPTWGTAFTIGQTRQRVGDNQTTAARNHAVLSISWNGLLRQLH